MTHELKLVPKTNIGELFANWCFYSGLLAIFFKLADLGSFATASWWVVLLPWLIPFGLMALVFVIAALITLVGRVMQGTGKIEVTSTIDDE